MFTYSMGRVGCAIVNDEFGGRKCIGKSKSCFAMFLNGIKWVCCDSCK